MHPKAPESRPAGYPVDRAGRVCWSIAHDRSGFAGKSAMNTYMEERGL